LHIDADYYFIHLDVKIAKFGLTRYCTHTDVMTIAFAKLVHERYTHTAAAT